MGRRHAVGHAPAPARRVHGRAVVHPAAGARGAAREGERTLDERKNERRAGHAAAAGAVTRMSRWAPGTVSPEPSVHDWCEEVFIVSGTLTIGTPENEEKVLTPGTYAVRPPHVPHGPFFTRDGCTMIEFLYYPPK